ncbi:acyltransferase [Pseudomonas sp. BW16M2]|uniref:acyltransferase family protein n=1 Tax=Pseudomonas sp. BW16M2 TaxID=2745489 RepID=UPI0016465C02|nr:acyltransferase family protein [Pseudomonas sp. BW16M2]MBC3436028.1 acyltransferase [Pseudomonas sp. BW16M2]
MEFRKDINGLRALAVLAVVVYHFDALWLPGGFAGVDVFFVISGYLMTAIVCRGLAGSTFSLLGFYKARAKRIVPVLAVMCGVLMAFGWFALLPTEYKEMARHVYSSLAFYSNNLYLREAGYFTASTNERWLLHTWSLSVEWQFYMVYPIVLMVLARLFGINAIRGCVLAAVLIGFTYSVILTGKHPEKAFYLLASRAWELCAGGLAFLFPLKLERARGRLVEWMGLALILASYVLISKAVRWPGYYALMPVLGTLMVIVANRQDSLLTGNRVFQQVGLYSYSIYIWHWPVMVYMSYSGLLHDVSSRVIGMIVSLLLGYVSYSMIERTRRTHAGAGGALAWCAAVIGVVAMSVFIYKVDGLNSSIRGEDINEKSQFIDEYAVLHKQLAEPYWLKCNAYEVSVATGGTRIDASCTEKKGEGGVFLWGDSHAEALSYGIRSNLPAGVPFYQVTSSACGATLGKDKASAEFQPTCNASNGFALEEIARLRPEIVVMAQQQFHELTDWNEIAVHLRSLGVRDVVLVGPVPQWRPSLPIVMVKRHWHSTDARIVDQGLDPRMLASDAALKQKLDPALITYISIIGGVCEGGACLAKVDDGKSLLVVDYGHLTPSASLYLGRTLILPRLKQLLRVAQG